MKFTCLFDIKSRHIIITNQFQHLLPYCKVVEEHFVSIQVECYGDDFKDFVKRSINVKVDNIDSIMSMIKSISDCLDNNTNILKGIILFK